MLERWYTKDNTKDRTVEVSVVTGPKVELINTDIDYSYVLANDIFSEGTDPLYSGNWKVVVTEGATENVTYTIKVDVYTSATDYTTYAGNEKFEINSNVTKVVINVTASSN